MSSTPAPRPNPLLETLSARGRKAFNRLKAEFEFAGGESFALDLPDRAGLYFIEQGRVDVEHTYPEQTPHQCDRREAGEYFGEYVVLDGLRQMTVHVLEDTRGVWIPANRFAQLTEAEPSIVLNLTRMLLQHQAQQDRKRIEQLKRTKAEAERTLARLEAVTETSEAINRVHDLDELLQVILREARTLVNAERGTVYLVDRDARQLYSYVSENGQRLKITLPFGKGFAGIAAERGITICTDDAYLDPRFNPDVDRETGFQTKSVLTMPVRNPRQEIVGVIQLLNKQDGSFTRDDEDVIATFGTHAAIAIERAQSAEATLRSQKLATVGNLAAAIVHDLKSPLTIIQGYVDLLNFTMESGSQRNHLEHISAQLSRMAGMTQEVLDYARGQVRLNPVHVSVVDLLNNLATPFQHDLKQRRIDFSLESDLPSDWKVILDQDRFTRVFHNLVTNAVEAMPEGGSLAISASRDEKCWELRVSDSGIGIPQGRLDSIFDPFATHGKPRGTGLGLCIAKSVIEEHGGSISVESVEGEGTTFIIRMPHRPKMSAQPHLNTIAINALYGLQTLTGSAVSSDGDALSMN